MPYVIWLQLRQTPGKRFEKKLMKWDTGEPWKKITFRLVMNYWSGGGLMIEDGVSAAQKLLKLYKNPDAILAIREEIGVGAIINLKK